MSITILPTPPIPTIYITVQLHNHHDEAGYWISKDSPDTNDYDEFVRYGKFIPCKKGTESLEAGIMINILFAAGVYVVLF